MYSVGLSWVIFIYFSLLVYVVGNNLGFKKIGFEFRMKLCYSLDKKIVLGDFVFSGLNFIDI